jgi:hypothetical protein
LAVSGPPAAAADDTTGGDTYSVTFVARTCPQYTDVRANRARNNLMESLQDLGPDTNYVSGQAVNPQKEDAAPQSACAPLTGWQFQSGTGITGKTPGTLNLSTVTGTSDSRIVTTTASVPELDAGGNDTGRSIAGAVTVALTAEQVQQAQKRQFWVQGGTKANPLGLPPTFGPTQYGFAALRCANDNLNGDNVEFVNFTTTQRHVFCYYYAVQPPPDSGTIVIRKAVANPAEAPDLTFDFGGNLSYNPGGAFALKRGQEITFIRGESSDVGFDWRATETVPDDWELTSVACVVTGSQQQSQWTTVTDGVDITLVAGETVTCTFTNTYDPPPPPTDTLEIDKYAFGSSGTFGWTLTDPDDTEIGTGSVTVDNNEFGAMFSGEITEEGTYTLVEDLPTDPNGSWELTEVLCDGADAEIIGTDTAEITPDSISGLEVYCILVNTFTPYTGALVIRSTTSGAAGGESTYEATPLAVTGIGDPVVYYQSANNTSDGPPPVTATGDDTSALVPQSYVVTGFGPAASATGSWALTSLACEGGSLVGEPDLTLGRVIVIVPPQGTATCDFEWTLRPPATLDVTKAVVLAGGSRTGTVVIDVACDDGTAATLTVAASDGVPASLTPPLGFVGDTTCDVTETANGGSNVTTAWQVVRPEDTTTGSGGSTSVLVEHTLHPGGAYAVTITNTYGSGPRPPTPTPTPTPTVSPTPTPTPTPSPTPSPTVTPTPTPSPTREPQRPVTPPRFPATIEPSVPTVVLPGTITTNAGRTLSSRVFCTPLRKAIRAGSAEQPTGDIRPCQIRRTKKGRITVTVLVPPVRVTLIQTAPGTAEFRPYRKVTTWVVR